MCGIACTMFAPSADTAQRKNGAAVFTANLKANEARGKDASGVLLLRKDGSYLIEKAPVRATEFVEHKGYQKIIDGVDNDCVLLLGHTRRPTKGTVTNTNNNHPIVRGGTIGVHNGTISNDDEIFNHHLQAGTDSRIGSVDSEAIFALIDETPYQRTLTRHSETLSELSQLLLGSYTTLYTQPVDPYRLYLLKYNNPISVHYSPQHRSLFFSSRYVFLRKAFGRAVITECLPSRFGYIFDARLLVRRKKTPLLSFPLAQQSDILA
ncbi:MAG: hypothetical protein ABFS19_06040 [Thermodesulfobacteriota bacterium]